MEHFATDGSRYEIVNIFNHFIISFANREIFLKTKILLNLNIKKGSFFKDKEWKVNFATYYLMYDNKNFFKYIEFSWYGKFLDINKSVHAALKRALES